MYQPLLIKEEQYHIDLNGLAEFDEHWHSEIEIIYCYSGRGYIKVNGRDICLGANQAVFIASGEKHEILGSDEGSEILVLEMGYIFLGKEFSKLSELEFYPEVLDLQEKRYFDLKESLDCIVRIKKRDMQTESDIWNEKGRLFLLAAVIAEKVPSKRQISPERRRRLKGIMDIQPVIEYIQSYYTQPITVMEAAQIVGYEPNYFCRRFKEATQHSFHSYLNNYRIMVARNLIHANQYTLGEIGEMVGIPEQKSFSRIFRQKMGQSPTEYRKQYEKLKAAEDHS